MTDLSNTEKYGNLVKVNKYENVGLWLEFADVNGTSIAFHAFRNVVFLNKLLDKNNKFICVVVGIGTINNSLFRARLDTPEECKEFSNNYINFLNEIKNG